MCQHTSFIYTKFVQIKLGFMHWGQGTSAQGHQMCQQRRKECACVWRHRKSRSRLSTSVLLRERAARAQALQCTAAKCTRRFASLQNVSKSADDHLSALTVSSTSRPKRRRTMRPSRSGLMSSRNRAALSPPVAASASDSWSNSSSAACTPRLPLKPAKCSRLHHDGA